MNEVETKVELIDPMLKAHCWGVVDGLDILLSETCKKTIRC